MYARSTTISAHPSYIDAGIKHMSDVVMPALADHEGCAGLSLLVDRDGGRCIATSSWLDEDTLRASEAPVNALREQAATIFHGAVAVARWEIAALHRDHRSARGACVRVTWLRIEPGHMSHAVDVVKLVALPAMDEMDGFCSASMMIDNAAGRAVLSVTFDSRAALERDRNTIDERRAATIREMGATMLDTCDFDLAIAHLNVPEMA